MGDPRNLPIGVPSDIMAPSAFRSGRGAAFPGVEGEGPGAVAEGRGWGFPPDFYPPPGSIDYMFYRTLLGAVAAGGAWANIGAPLQLPANSPGIIRDFEVEIAGAIALGTQVAFRIVVNNVPQSGWDNVTVLGRVAAFVGVSFLPDSVYIRLPPAALVGVQFRVDPADPGSYNIGARLRGWSWSAR